MTRCDASRVWFFPLLLAACAGARPTSTPLTSGSAGAPPASHAASQAAVTSELSELRLGCRTFFWLEPMEGWLHVEMVTRFSNLSSAAWRAEGVTLTLPPGFVDLESVPKGPDPHFEAEGERGVRLVGTFTPGQHDISLLFELPRSGSSVSFTAPLLPRTVETRVLVVAKPQTKLELPDFEEPRNAKGPHGEPVLVARRLVTRGEPGLRDFQITVTGL